MAPWKTVEITSDLRRVHRKVPVLYISQDFVRLGAGVIREFFAGYDEQNMYVEILRDGMKVGFRPNKEKMGARISVIRKKDTRQFATARICGRDTIRSAGLVPYVGLKFVPKSSSTEEGIFFIVLSQGVAGV